MTRPVRARGTAASAPVLGTPVLGVSNLGAPVLGVSNLGAPVLGVSVLGAFVGAVVLGACGGGAGDWGGTIADSAGITVVRNPAQSAWSLRPMPRLVEELRIGAIEGAAELQFGQITAIDVDAEDNIYVLDTQAAQVRVFAEDGRFLRAVGGPGGGPGELSMMTTAVLAGDDGTVFVADAMRQRIAALAPDGTEIGSTPVLMQHGIPVRWEVTPEKRFAVQVRAMPFPGMDSVVMRDHILLRDPRSERADTLLQMEAGQTFRFEGGGPPRMRLFEAEPVWTLLQNGRIARGRNDSYRIEILAPGGAVERVITRPFERQAVTTADRDAFRDAMLQMVQQQGAPPAAAQQFVQGMEFADYYPAYATMLGGPDGTLWVQRILTAEHVRRDDATFNPQDLGSPEWDVFDADGRLLGMLRMPDRFQPLHVAGERLHGVLRDELDVPHVVRLRLVEW